MPVITNVTKIVHCDKAGCEFEITYEANPSPDVLEPLKQVVMVVEPTTQMENVCCSDECAILGIEAKCHRKQVQLIVEGNEAVKHMKDGKNVIH